ncbi:MAG: hypothetical protein JXQ87_01110 [Bacteroidia bacterium]
MKFKGLLLGMAMVLASVFTNAQNPYYTADLSIGSTTNLFVGALSFNRTHTILSEKLHLGYGLRFNLHTGSNQTYITAPFKYTGEGLIDSMSIDNINTMGLSASINLGFSISEKLMVGFNIDALGLSFGGAQDVRIKQWVDDPSGATQTLTTATPTTLNLLLVGDNDIGTLNSEFYIRYMFNDNLGARLGMSMFFSEYTTEAAGHDNNKRFRNKIQYPFIALSYKL